MRSTFKLLFYINRQKTKKNGRCLQDYRNQERIPYIQLGGKILYKASDIEKLLEDNYHKALE